MTLQKISIIVPVFNEVQSIEKVIETVSTADTLNLDKEIIIVDDGSNDGTTDIVKRLTETFSQVKALYHDHNMGKGAAIRTALPHTTGDIVLIQDADLEYSPSDYPVLIQPFFDANADVVYGSRFVSAQPHRVLYYWHYVANNLLTTLSNIFTNLNLTDMETGFKVFKGHLIRNLASKLRYNDFGFEPEITALISKQKNILIYEVGISYFGRTYEEGKKIGWHDGLKAIMQIFVSNLSH